MTDDEARKLATRIVDTWPTGPKAYIWRDLLIALDAKASAAAYRTLTLDDRAGKSPTPAQFHAHYRLARRDGDNTPTGPTFDAPAIPLSDPRATEAFNRGYALGLVELRELRQVEP
jgi:hypothetical protein